MSMRVFHAPGPFAPGQRLTLDAEESRYVLRVRRARPGAALEVLDGERQAWTARLLDAGDERAAVVELQGPCPAVAVIPLALLLVMPEPRATLEALGHASELGATEVWLIDGDHSPGGAPSSGRITRTLRASQRQCGRPTPPVVQGPGTLGEALARTADRPGHVARASDRGRATPVEVNPDTGARLLVGPEGGLSAAEQDMAAAAGLRPLALGPWVLRSPTAVAAGLARLRGVCVGPPEPEPRP